MIQQKTKHSVTRRQKARSTMVGFLILILLSVTLLCASFWLIRGNITLGKGKTPAVTEAPSSAVQTTGE